MRPARTTTKQCGTIWMRRSTNRSGGLRRICSKIRSIPTPIASSKNTARRYDQMSHVYEKTWRPKKTQEDRTWSSREFHAYARPWWVSTVTQLRNATSKQVQDRVGYRGQSSSCWPGQERSSHEEGGDSFRALASRCSLDRRVSICGSIQRSNVELTQSKLSKDLALKECTQVK